MNVDRQRPLRFAVDTGGTFTDLVVEGDVRGPRFFKRPTTPDDTISGLLETFRAAAIQFQTTLEQLLGRGQLLIHGTTRATNAIVTGNTAKTAFLTTQGHPDILLFREGAERVPPYDYTLVYPEPYVPRALTFQVPERIRANGEAKVPLQEGAVVAILDQLRELEIEAVGVCLLWSIVNPVHELKVGELLDQHLPGVPYTLSHVLNPTLREYRRASATVIDASLKPLMTSYIDDLERRLRSEGFAGRLLILTSAGGVQDAEEVAKTPIHTIGSGPAAAPVAGRYFAERDAQMDTAIVTDAGGTTFDVSLIRRRRIPWTRETIIGHPKLGYITGFPSIDVRSIGAGGGSIAWVDDGGLLHVGPQSAGSAPGPACYGQGGTKPTVTDACVVLGYIDPDFFLGGEMVLMPELAVEAIERGVASPLAYGLQEAAAAVFNLACERMVNAIEEITLLQGVDARRAVMIGGGGGGGLYAVAIARRLGTPAVLIPEAAATLSATGALLSELKSEYALARFTTTAAFDFQAANSAIADLSSRCHAFIEGTGPSTISSAVEFSVEARYPDQVWEIDLPLRVHAFADNTDVEQLERDFHALHDKLFSISDVDSAVEIVLWRARVSCDLRSTSWAANLSHAAGGTSPIARPAFFSMIGAVDAVVRRIESVEGGETIRGPAIIEAAAENVVVPPGAAVERLSSGSLLVHPFDSPHQGTTTGVQVSSDS